MAQRPYLKLYEPKKMWNSSTDKLKGLIHGLG